MRKEKKLLLTAACLFGLGIGSLSANNFLHVHFVGQENTEMTELGSIDKVTFSKTGFSILLKNQTTEDFSFENVTKITFGDETGVQAEMAENFDLVVSPNPVGATLNVKGYNATEPAQLVIYSVAGGEVLRANAWKGESLDVAHLASGIYILKIDNQTLKFIKK